MADENLQTAPVADAQETATQSVATENAKEVLQSPHVYYYSDPSATDERLHHLPIPTIMNLDDLVMDGGNGALWHWFKTEPPKDMKDPIFDTDAGKWIENSENEQTKIIAEAQTKIDELDKKTAEFNQAQQASAQQSVMITKQLGQVMQMMQMMQKTMSSMAKPQVQPTKPEEKPQTTTVENGGNN